MYCTSLGYHVFVNLPLLGLALNFAAFVPLAVVSFMLSLGTCVLAALQANLPRHKRRFWSRPLVALLFFLQPIVRGWARFKWRISIKSRAPVEAGLVPRSMESPDTFAYWSDVNFDRLKFLHEILNRFESDRRPVRADTGWESHDLEVLASAWIRLRLATATEELEMGKRQLRCRLTTQWSFLARVLFGLLTVAVVLFVAIFAREIPWAWFSLLSLAFLAWHFEDECCFHKSNLARLIGDVCDANKMLRIGD
jgi:hypothetical protein